MKIALGCAREALFYNEFAAQLSDANVPMCYFAEGDMATGAMLMLIEYMDNAVPAGIFFGAENPNNWSIKEKLEEMCEGNPTAEETTKDAFHLYARLHARFWQDPKLLAHDWVRASSWYKGEDVEGWNASQKQSADMWMALTKAMEEGTSTIRWDAHLVSCINSSMAKIAFATFHDEIKTRPFTLVHGDCHPHNVLWTQQRTASAKLRLIDFEMVGVGSPTQDLGQWMISHFEPKARRACEKELLTAYHADIQDILHQTGKEAEASAFTFDACWAEYVAGGAGRWVWFVPVLVTMTPPPMGQFFADQLAAFLHDHVPNPLDSPMPRV